MTASVSVQEDERRAETTTTRRDESGRLGEPDTGTPEGVDRLPNDLVFGLLANERSRTILYYLVDNPERSTLGELAEHIASSENDKPVTALSSTERKPVYICLYQCHLPKMDDANVIDYNKPKGWVELRPEADQLLRYLPDDPGETDQTSTRLRALIPTSLLALASGLRG